MTIDLDVTDDTTHGQQQLSLFNGFYRSWCYLPLLGFVSFDDEPEQYLLAAMLRPGNAPTKLGALGLLRRIIARVGRAFPQARMLVRLDGGFACPELFDFLDQQPRLDYVVAMAKNKVLERRAQLLMTKARRLSRETKRTERVFGECSYVARTWSRKRRVVIKAEVVRLEGRKPKNNPRFVVTNLRRVHEVLSTRRDREPDQRAATGIGDRSHELLSILGQSIPSAADRSGYVLMQELRLQAKHTSCRRAQVWTLRERLLKLGAQIEVSVRRILLRLPESSPFTDAWCRTALALGAPAG